MPMLSFDLTESKVIRAGKIAAALFAAYFAYFLWQTILSDATEPKVIGGLHLDQPPPENDALVTRLYSHGCYAAVCVRHMAPANTSRGDRCFRASFARLRRELSVLFISIFCPGLGGVLICCYLCLSAGEIPSVLVKLACLRLERSPSC